MKVFCQVFNKMLSRATVNGYLQLLILLKCQKEHKFFSTVSSCSLLLPKILVCVKKTCAWGYNSLLGRKLGTFSQKTTASSCFDLTQDYLYILDIFKSKALTMIFLRYTFVVKVVQIFGSVSLMYSIVSEQVFSVTLWQHTIHYLFL